MEQGKNSESAKELAQEIDELSGELADNKKAMQEADKAADDLDKSLDDVDAEGAADGFTVLKGAIADLVANGIRKCIEALKDFAKEVMEKFLTCHVHEYMDLLDKRLGKKKRRDLKSTYNYLKGMGYSALDDYDSLYECAQQVTHLSHQSEYYKRLIDYYIYKDMFIEAQDLMIKLAELNAKVKSKVYKDSIDVSLKLFDCRIKVKTGNYAGVEECYTQMLSSHETAVLSLISKVSISYALGELLVKKGEKERAKEHLKFASEKGGDTKYKIFADRLLSEIEEEAVPFA